MPTAKRATKRSSRRPAENGQGTSAHLHRMLSLSPAVIYSCDPGPDYPTTYISHNVVDRLGYMPADFYTDSFLWTKLLHPDDASYVLRKLARIGEVNQISYEYRVRHRCGHYLWLHDQVSAIRDTAGDVSMIVGCWVDVSERKRAEAFQAGQSRVLTCLVEEASLEESLTQLARAIEAQVPDMICSILILDEATKCLRLGAAPSLANAYNEAIDGIEIGPSVGSCGTAAFRGERVIVEDIETDPLWKDFRTLAREHRLRACWSQPILGATGGVLGTFAMYYQDVRKPSRSELELIERAASLAAVAIQRKRADEALQASEKRYHDLYDNAPDMFASVDAKTGKVIQCNNTLAFSTGYTKEEIVGRPIFDLYHPDCRADVQRCFDLFVRTGSVRDEDLQLRRKDGSKIDVSLNTSAVRDDAGHVLYCRSILRDITERKRAEAAQREQTRLTEFAADVRASFGQKKNIRKILQRCAEAMVRHLDAAFARIWTLNRTDNVLELQASAGIYTHTDGAHSRIRMGELKIGLIAQERTPHLTNDVVGDPRIDHQEWAKREGMVAFAGYPLLVEDDVVGVMAMFSRKPLTEATVQAMSGVAHSVALGIERKNSEEALHRSERLASIGTLAAGIAHEVNNPLTAILLAAQSALESTNKKDRQRYMKQCLEGIVKDAGRCEQIVSSVLQFARSGTAKKGPTDLAKIIQRTVNLLQAYAEEKGANLDLQLEESLPLIALNPGQMEQVFVNLIRNAVESGERGNRVSVAVTRTAQTVRILVGDKGRGMTREQRNRLFDPFYTTREREGGTGLGLSIVHGIVLAHGGKIDVDSRLGQGTTMTIELPLPKSNQQSQ